MLTIIIILSIISLILLFFVINLYRKLISFEKYNEELETGLNGFGNFLTYIQSKIGQEYSNLKAVDKNGSFSSDDEVGSAFKTIKEIYENLDIFLRNVMEEEEGGVDEENKEENVTEKLNDKSID